MATHLLYDPDCGFCTATAQRIQRWHLAARIEPLSPELLECWEIDADRARREIPFVDAQGRVSFGARAIGAALATGNQPLRLLGLLISQRPVVWLAQPVYRWVAAHRHELPGGTAACAMPQRDTD